MQECLKIAGVPESNGQPRLFSVTMDPQGQCKFHNRPYLAMLTAAVQTGRGPESLR